MLKKIVENTIKFKHSLISVLFVVLSVSTFFTIKNLDIDNSLKIWFLDDDPSYKAYIDFQEEFGSDEIFVTMFPLKEELEKSQIIQLKSLHAQIDSLFYVGSSYSLVKAKYPILGNSKILFSDFYNEKRSLKSQKKLLSKLPAVSYQLVSEDYKNLFFYIQLKPTPEIEQNRKEIYGEITSIIDTHFKDYYITGPPVLNEAYSKGIYKESLLFGVLTILVITLMLLFLLPDKRYLVLALLALFIPLVILFGIMSALGFALNMISMLIPTILMVYSVSDAVHIINIYHTEGLKNESLPKKELIILAIKKSLIPCFYTTLTTFVGYFALYLSPLPAFKNMGVFTCVGLVLSFTLVYVISIIGFYVLNIDFKNAKPFFRLSNTSQIQFIKRLNKFTSNFKNSIIIVFLGVLLFGFYAIYNVKIDTNSLNLLAEGKAKNDLRIIESKIKGTSRMQLDIALNNTTSALQKETILKLEEFQKKLNNNPLIYNAISVVNIKQFLEQRQTSLFQNTVSKEKIEQSLKELDNKTNDFYKLFSDDFSSVAITISFKEANTSQLEQLIFDIKSDFKSIFNLEEYTLKINGFAVVFAQLNKFILQTQFKSFFAAFIIAFLCLLVFIRSIKSTILILIPNVIPLVVLAILMYLLGISLDVTTAMITPIMLGIAMDDTIHLVYKYRRAKVETRSVDYRIDKAMEYTGNALLSTTIALVAGFLIIASSATPSVRDFGLLCATTVAIALITDILFLPALLKKFDN